MNTSPHVSLGSGTKIKNLMIATRDVIEQLRHEGRHVSADALVEAHRYMGLAVNRQHQIDATEERTND